MTAVRTSSAESTQAAVGEKSGRGRENRKEKRRQHQMMRSKAAAKTPDSSFKSKHKGLNQQELTLKSVVNRNSITQESESLIRIDSQDLDIVLNGANRRSVGTHNGNDDTI